MVRLRRILRSDSACSRTRRTANSATASTATDLGLRFGGTVVAALSLWSFDGAFAQDTSFGQRLFQDKADCQFCHGINGDGSRIEVWRYGGRGFVAVVVRWCVCAGYFVRTAPVPGQGGLPILPRHQRRRISD